MDVRLVRAAQGRLSYAEQKQTDKISYFYGDIPLLLATAFQVQLASISNLPAKSRLMLRLFEKRQSEVL